MTAAPSYISVKKHYNAGQKTIRDYFSNFESLIDDYEYQVVVAYCFFRLEAAYNRTLYGGVRKLHKADKDLATTIIDKQHLTRDGFLDLYSNVFGKPLPNATVAKIKFAEGIRDRVVHGKSVKDADARKCLTDVIDFSHELEQQVQSLASFSPFGTMKGLIGAGKSLDARTTRWLMKGLGFAVA